MLLKSSALYRELYEKLEEAVDRFLRYIESYPWDDLSLAERRLVLLSRRWENFYNYFNYESAYDIDIFCELEWLLRGLLDLNKHSARPMPTLSMRDVLRKMLESLQPIADTCRCIYAACTFSATARSKYLSKPTPISWDEERNVHRRIRQVSSIVLKDLERSPLALENMLDVMLEIAMRMRSQEEHSSSHGKITHKLFWHGLHRYLPRGYLIFTRHAISISSKHFHMFSNVHIYGIVCFNILTANVPGMLKLKRPVKSISAFYKFVIKGSWKRLVHGQPEYLVRLVAWCWETDPSKRPVFSTICSLLQRAMRCLIFPPVLNLKRLSNFLQQREYNLLHLYLSFVWSQDISLSLLGTRLIGELVEAFHSDTIEQQRFSSDVMCKKVMQAFAQINACERDVETMVSRHQNSTESANLSSYEEDGRDYCNNRLIPSLTGELQLKSLIDMEKKFDSRSTEVLNSDVFEKHAVIFEALAYDCMLATFPPLDYEFWIRPLVNLSQHGRKLPIPRPDTLVQEFSSEKEIPSHLFPQFVGFWEGV